MPITRPLGPLNQLLAQLPATWDSIDALVTAGVSFISSDYASLDAAITAIGSTPGALFIRSANFPSGATCTVPSTLVIEWGDAGTLLLTTGHTVTINSDTSRYPLRKLFFNALASQGTMSFVGNRSADFWLEWWGGAADDSTDNSGALQAIFDMANSGNRSVQIRCLQGTYRFAGALQDTSFSNSQIVLPKRALTSDPVAIRILGVDLPHPFPHPSGGTIFESTLSSGTGSFMSVKSNWGSGASAQGDVVRQHISAISFEAENITFRMVANPTNSCLNFSFVPNVRLTNVLIDVDGLSLSAGNLIITEPTTSTSYGLITPVDFAPNACILDHVLIIGYYTAARFGELVYSTFMECAAVKVGIELRGMSHACHLDKLLIVNCATLIKTAGKDPVFSTGNDNCLMSIDQFDYENGGTPAWTTTTYHLDDANNYLTGDINWSSTLWDFTKNGGANVKAHPLHKPWHLHRPFANITGSDLDASNHAVHEIYRGSATSDSSKAAWLSLVSKQSGTAHLIGVVVFSNDQIANGSDKRLVEFTVATDGAINSGKLVLDMMNGGTLAAKAVWDKTGNYSIVGILGSSEGGTLSITSNTIAPTSMCHPVGAGLIKTITPPSAISTGTFTVKLLPTAAFTYDNTGNILGSGTAVVDRPMDATWIPSLSKWMMSY